MSNVRTSHGSARTTDDGYPSTPEDALRRAAGILLALLAAGLLALHATLTHGLTSEYGFVPGDLQPIDGMVLLLVAGLDLLLLLAARRLLGVRRPTAAVLAVVVPAVFCGAAAVSATLGGAAHDRRTTTVRTACSAQDREQLAAVEYPGFRLGPFGDPDGGCVLRLSPQTHDAATAVADLTADLVGEGWRTTGAIYQTVMLERDGAVLTVNAETDGKAVELVLTLR